MRVLLYHFAELGALGGVEATVCSLAQGLKERGIPCGIVEMADCWKPKRLLPQKDIPVWGVTKSSYPTPGRPRSWLSFMRSTWQLEKILLDFQPDILNVHFPLAQSLPVVGAHFLPHRWRLVVTLQNSEIRVAPFTEPRMRPWQERLFNRADAVTAVSRALLEDTQKLYNCVSGKIHVIHNSVERMWFERDGKGGENGERYVLFAGRFHEMKGVDLLLKAWKQVYLHFPETALWLVGKGPELDNLRRLAEELGVTSSVKFMGPRSREDLPPLYRNAEIVVLPSRREGLPLNLLEAGACGALCVGTDVVGIPEIIEDGVNGFLAEPESPEALAQALLRALRLSPDERQCIKEAARSNVRQFFTQEKIISDYLNLYNLLLVAESGLGR